MKKILFYNEFIRIYTNLFNRFLAYNEIDMNLIYAQESYRINGVVMEVYNYLGPGFSEAVYQEALEVELNNSGIPFEREKELFVNYKGAILKKTFIPDFVFYDKIVMEIKAVPELDDANRAQLYNYLKVSNYRLGLLVNFGNDEGVVIERLINRHYQNPI